MNYYDRNPGDIAKHTFHLTMQQMGALVLMEDFCHGTERLLPDDDALFFTLMRAKSRSEKADAIKIRAEFFEKTADGWINQEIEQRIFAKVGKSGKATRAANARWEKHRKAHADALRMQSERIASEQSARDANAMPPRTNSQEPITNNHSGASSAGVVDVDLAVLESHPESEKKEGGADAEVWLNVDSDEARRVINRALGREERRAFTGAELHALGIYAGQHDGQISATGFDTLKRYLLAEPRYDCRDQRLMAAVPEGSLLRKRRRFGSAVLEDLPNQLEHAARWLAEGQKKETGAGLKLEPVWNWREFAMSRLGMETDLPWRVLLARHKQEILNAWSSTDEKQKAEFEALATT